MARQLYACTEDRRNKTGHLGPNLNWRDTLHIFGVKVWTFPSLSYDVSSRMWKFISTCNQMIIACGLTLTSTRVLPHVPVTVVRIPSFAPPQPPKPGIDSMHWLLQPSTLWSYAAGVKCYQRYLYVCQACHPRRPIRAWLYYDSPSATACFSSASFANFYCQATQILTADQVRRVSECAHQGLPQGFHFYSWFKRSFDMLIMSLDRGIQLVVSI